MRTFSVPVEPNDLAFSGGMESSTPNPVSPFAILDEVESRVARIQELHNETASRLAFYLNPDSEPDGMNAKASPLVNSSPLSERLHSLANSLGYLIDDMSRLQRRIAK